MITSAIAGFRDTYLKPYIDRTTKPWRWKSGQQFGLGFPDEVLAAFEKADDITTVFFAGQEKPNVDFTVEVGKLDMTARAFLLDIGGKVASYTHGPPAGTQYLWPPENLVAGASMSMTPEVAGQRKLLKWSIPGAAHAFVMYAFLILATVYLEAYGILLSTNEKWAIPVVGHWEILGFLQDFIAVMCLVGLLTFIAAALRRYPYGGHVKLNIYMAPAFCMLAGLGGAFFVRWLARWRGAATRGTSPTVRCRP